MERKFAHRNMILSEESRVRGMLVPQRSERNMNIKAPNENAILPFISTVTAKEPLGIRTIHKTVVIQRPKIHNEAIIRNRKNIQEIIEKSKTKKNDDNHLIFYKSASCKMMKIKEKKANCNFNNKQEHEKDNNYCQLPSVKELIQNEIIVPKEINEISQSKEIAKEEKPMEKETHNKKIDIDNKPKESLIEKIKDCTENIKESPAMIPYKESEPITKEEEVKNEEKLNLHKLMEELDNEEDNQQEMNNILGYINNLDYDKYSRDLEIREALQLIKNKMEKEREEDMKNHPENYTNQDKTDNLTIRHKENSQVKKEEDAKDNDNEKKKLSEIKPVPMTKEEEEKDEEIKKYQLAEKVSKCDPKLRAIHSYKSIRRLLDREGLSDINMIDPLKITLIQERGRLADDDYISNKLPFLHSLPLV